MAPSTRTDEARFADHIEAERKVWSDLQAWQASVDAKLDSIATALSLNTATCDEIRSYQTAGRVLTGAVKWTGGIAAAGAGMVGLWVAIKTVLGSSPPGPQ